MAGTDISRLKIRLNKSIDRDVTRKYVANEMINVAINGKYNGRKSENLAFGASRNSNEKRIVTIHRATLRNSIVMTIFLKNIYI